MLSHYKYFVQNRLEVDKYCSDTTLYVTDIFSDTYWVSYSHYAFLAKAGSTKLIRALLC